MIITKNTHCNRIVTASAGYSNALPVNFTLLLKLWFIYLWLM